MAQPCFPGEITTAAYATGGESEYIEDVLWLTWGSNDIDDHPYGQHNQPLGEGAASYASIPVGGGKYLCLQATIENIQGRGGISSYAPGNWGGDYMDNLYNIGGDGAANKLVNGIKNSTAGQRVSFTIKCRATLDNLPVRIAGLVFGDAESLAVPEWFEATADGTWHIVELKKNLGAGDYKVEKTNIIEGSITKQKMAFISGNNSNTAAVSFLAFNQSAYRPAEEAYEVSFDVVLQGNPQNPGITAIALGIITLGADGGDAPESYGAPIHILEGLAFTDDHIPPNGQTVNLNTTSYEPGSLALPSSNFLGSTGPDADNGTQYSQNALGDDNNPNGPSNEEDAWPIAHKRWSYNATYKQGNMLNIDIPYNGLVDAHIIGWIDFNWNGEFEGSERATAEAPAGSDVATLTWTIPDDRIAKSTYVRLRYAINKDEIESPTTVATGGEVEDHFIYILGPATTNPMLPSKVKQPTQSQ